MFDLNIRNLDVHMHSTESDGTNSPEEFPDLIEKAGICIFSITDHDATDGAIRVEEMLAGKGAEPGVLFTKGVEFSCRDDQGKYHILGYGYDIGKPFVQETVDKAHALRMSKVTGRLDFLKDEFGFRFYEEDKACLLALPNPGKPHIGNLMAEYGYAPNKDVAITDYINLYKEPNAYLSPQDAIDAITASGGIPVLAHPHFGNGSQRIYGKDLEDRLERLTAMGIQGVEAFYSGFSRDLISHTLSLAQKHNLYVTAGSDYHGANKTVPLGHTNFTDSWDMPHGMIGFLERVFDGQ